MGISADRIKTVSYGKAKPLCTKRDESCWRQNRRGISSIKMTIATVWASDHRLARSGLC